MSENKTEVIIETPIIEEIMGKRRNFDGTVEKGR